MFLQISLISNLTENSWILLFLHPIANDGKYHGDPWGPRGESEIGKRYDHSFNPMGPSKRGPQRHGAPGPPFGDPHLKHSDFLVM